MYSFSKISLPVCILVFFTGILVLHNQPVFAIPLQETETAIPGSNDLDVTSEKDIPHAIFIVDKHLKSGNYQDVVAITTKVLGIDQNHIEAHAYLAAAYKGLNDKENSAKEVVLVKKLSPESPALSKATAALYLSLGDLKQAESTYNNGIKSFSENAGLRMALASLYLAEGKTKEAEEQYREVLKQEKLPTQFFLNANFALCQMELQNKAYDAVIKRAKTITDFYPPVPQGHFFLGTAYVGKGQPQNAVEVYKNFKNINPDSPLSYQELARLYSDKLEKPAEGLYYAKEAVNKFPKDAKSHDILGWILLKNKSFPEALKHFKKATSLELGNPIYIYHLGLSHQEMGDKNEAAKAFELALVLIGQDTSKGFGKELKKRIEQCK